MDIKEKIKQITGRCDEECIIIDNILNNHFIIGKENRKRIIDDFMSKLNISYDEADDLYNKCSSIIVKGIFKRKEEKK